MKKAKQWVLPRLAASLDFGELSRAATRVCGDCVIATASTARRSSTSQLFPKAAGWPSRGIVRRSISSWLRSHPN